MNSLPRITNEEAVALWHRWSTNGDREAWDQLITSHIRLVAFTVRKHTFRATHVITKDDLFEAGNLGLIYGAKKFDPMKGTFSAYVGYWISSYILQLIKSQSWEGGTMGSGRACITLFFNFYKTCHKLREQGLAPTPHLVSRSLGIELSRVERFEQFMQTPKELDRRILTGDKDTVALGDTLPDDTPSAEERYDQAEREHQICAAIEVFKRTLCARDLAIFELRMLAEENPATLQEIGDKFGVSRERIRQNETKIKTRFKTHCEQSGLLSLIAER